MTNEQIVDQLGKIAERALFAENLWHQCDVVRATCCLRHDLGAETAFVNKVAEHLMDRLTYEGFRHKTTRRFLGTWIWRRCRCWVPPNVRDGVMEELAKIRLKSGYSDEQIRAEIVKIRAGWDEDER
jgi:hypothetical protein